MNIVPTANIAAMSVSVALCLVVPALLFVLVVRKEKRLFSALLFGMLGFFLTQVLLRLPLLSFLGTQGWFQAFAANQTVLYALALAVTAALFETAGRLLVFKVLLPKRLSYCTAFSAGLGHGWIEAIVLVCVTYLNYILYSLQANSGTLVLTEGGTVTQVLSMIAGTQSMMFYLTGLERMCTIALHIALSVLLCKFIMQGRTVRGALLCFAIHAAVDFLAGLLSMLGADTLVVEGVVFLVALLAVVYLVASARSYPASRNVPAAKPGQPQAS